jgi:hypothetical protein
MLGIPFLAAFLAGLRPARWSPRVAGAVALAGLVAAAANALGLAQALAGLLAAWATLIAVQLVRERRNSWPVVIAVMAITYPLFTLDFFDGPGLEPAGFLAYVVAPGVICRGARSALSPPRRARASTRPSSPPTCSTRCRWRCRCATARAATCSSTAPGSGTTAMRARR